MSNDDWYRKTSWNQKNKEDFFARLKRSRDSYNKAQYLRIQAGYLQRDYPDDSKELLFMLFDQYPERSELASAYLQMAEIEVEQGYDEKAIEFFKKSIQQQREYPKSSNSSQSIPNPKSQI